MDDLPEFTSKRPSRINKILSERFCTLFQFSVIRLVFTVVQQTKLV